jgi:hypothetical protein
LLDGVALAKTCDSHRTPRPLMAAPTFRHLNHTYRVLSTFPNICFWTIEIGAMIAPMEAIDVGIVRTAAGCPAGQAWPRAFAQFGGGLCRGAARQAFTCKSRDKNLKYLESPAQGLCSVSGVWPVFSPSRTIRLGEAREGSAMEKSLQAFEIAQNGDGTTSRPAWELQRVKRTVFDT